MLAYLSKPWSVILLGLIAAWAWLGSSDQVEQNIALIFVGVAIFEVFLLSWKLIGDICRSRHARNETGGMTRNGVAN